MKAYGKTFQIVLISLIAVGIFLAVVIAQEQAPSPHWPSALTAGYLFGLGGADDGTKRAAYDFAARHLDYIASFDGHYIDYLLSINPTIQGIGKYEQFVSAIDPNQQQAVENRARDLGIDIDDAYIHYSIDRYPHPIRATYNVQDYYPWLGTEYDAEAGNYKVYVPGWDAQNDRNGDGYVDDSEYASLINPSAHARRKMESRAVDWSWGEVRGGELVEYPEWTVYPGNFEVAKVLVDYVEPNLDDPLEWGQSKTYDLIMWDSVAGWLNNYSITVEYSGDGGITRYREDIARLTEYSRKYGDKLLVGGNSTKGVWMIDQYLDVSIREGLINTWATARDWEGLLPGYYYGPLNSNSSYYKSRQSNKVQLLQHTYNLRYYIADTPEVWARDRIFGVAAYYLLQNPGKDYWNADSTNTRYWPTVSLQEKEWSHALEVDIGQPTDKVPDGVDAPNITYWGVWVFAEGADPGHPDYPDITKSRYKIYARDFTKGLVLLKPKSGNNPSLSTFADNTATTHQLPVTSDNPSGTYFMVYDDGSIDTTTPLTNITLRNGEATILIKESALQDGTEPPALEEEKFASDLSRVRAYPNPYKGDKHSQIIFDNLTANVRIKIYTLDGELVKEIGEQEGNKAYWDVKNKQGEKVTSGTYIYHITNPKGEEKKGKVAIIR